VLGDRQNDVVEISVRRAECYEARAVTTLHQHAARVGFAHIFPPDAAPPTFDDDLGRWQYWLGPDLDNGRRGYVATSNAGIIIGVVLAGPDADDPTTGHLSRLYVDPDHWSKGVGTELYGAAVADLTMHFDAATLWVLEGNDRARSWYERLGWQLTGRRTTTYAPAHIDDVQYRIDLTK
jgi:ribosomal protein S18 acetylase RimI-like enzyme